MYLSFTLAVTEFKLRFFGSALGYVWTLMRPLLLFGVLYFVFTEFVRIGEAVPHYPVVLLTNLVLFTFFSEATSAVDSVVENENLVRKIQFPRLAIPVSVVLTAAFNLSLNALVIMVFVLASGIEPRLSWLLLPVLIIGLVLLALGLAMLMAALYPRFRDVKPIWEVTIQLLFYATPVIYTVEALESHAPWVKEVVMASPLAAIFQEVRHSVIDSSAPSAAAAVGGTTRLLIPIGLVVALFLLGLWVFNREAPRIAEEL